MINTDTLNLLRLNSVSPHQPADRKTHTHASIHKLAHTHILLTRLDCQLAYSWEPVAMATPDVASEGLCISSSMLSSLVILSPLSIRRCTVTERGLNPDYASTPNYASIILVLPYEENVLNRT